VLINPEKNMNTEKKFSKACVVASTCVGLVLNVSVSADTLLFPVIAVNAPNVTTIVSVVNDSGAATRLRYIYRYKQAFAAGQPNLGGNCDSNAFNRNTYQNDIVSFDTSGAMNGGNALFGDNDTYGGGFALGQSGPNRAYLLVTHADNTGTRINVGSNIALSGEAINLDIATGAAWGMRGINDRSQEDYDIVSAFGGGGVYNVLPNVDAAKRFTFFPLDEWTTRFFVTPLGLNMDSANLSSIVRILGDVYDRERTAYPIPLTIPTVTCTGAVDLPDLMDSTAEAAVESTGGWASFQVAAGSPAVVYKLEYSSMPSYGGTNNNGYLLSDIGTP
jgi:hypothetical protein